MQRDYEIIDSENGIIRETKESLFIVDNGVFINPKHPLYNPLLRLCEEIAKAIKEINYECRTDD